MHNVFQKILPVDPIWKRFFEGQARECWNVLLSHAFQDHSYHPRKSKNTNWSFLYLLSKKEWLLHKKKDICWYTLPLGSLYFLHENQRSRKSLIFHHYAWSLRNYHQELHLFASVKKYSILSIVIDTELSEMD